VGDDERWWTLDNVLVLASELVRMSVYVLQVHVGSGCTRFSAALEAMFATDEQGSL